MSLKGFFAIDREERYLGRPIWVVLVLQNETNDALYLYIPRARANGIRITVTQGNDVELKDMTAEPEPGLVSEVRLDPGGTYRKEYPLTQWLRFKRPGHFTVSCTVPIDFSTVSSRQASGQSGATMLISTDLHVNILAPAPQDTEGG